MVEVTILGAFVLGLAHTLIPCEDKAIVSTFAAYAENKWKASLLLVTLYGAGMLVINTTFGVIAAYIGVKVLMGLNKPMGIISGILIMIMGFYMMGAFGHLHDVHRQKNMDVLVSDKGFLTILGLGLIRGVVICPFEAIALMWAMSVGDVIKGALAVAAFSLGTLIGLVPLGMVVGGITGLLVKKGKVSRSTIAKIAGAVCVLVGGMFLLTALMR